MSLLLVAWIASSCTAAIVPPPPSSPTPGFPRIGYLSPVGSNRNSPSLDAFRFAIAELGYVEGKNLQVEYRLIGEGERHQLPEAAAELAGMPVDAIVAIGNARVREAMNATDRVPIVMAAAVDPVEAGLISSLALPGGNVTGVATQSGRLAAKRLEFLHRTVPEMSRVAVLSTPRWKVPHSSAALQWAAIQEAAKALRLEVWLVEIPVNASPRGIVASVEEAIAAAAAEGADGLLPLGDALFDIRRIEVARMAKAAGLPSMYRRADFAEAGGLVAYGPNTLETMRRVALYVQKIVRGAVPTDLPVEQVDEFDLVINVETAKALGLTIPTPLLRHATRVVE